MRKLGFTLIELLVVIAIIGILFSVGLASYLTAQKQTRDARRKTDLLQIQQALESYRSEIGYYPDLIGWTTALAPNYITAVPSDPKSGSYRYAPGVGAAVATYSLCTTLEIIPAAPAITNCVAPENYEVKNP